MDKSIAVFINDHLVLVPDGVTVAAALMEDDTLHTRDSLHGAPRFAVCGMGVCQECRVTIGGVPHRLACQTICQPGMRIETGAPRCAL